MRSTRTPWKFLKKFRKGHKFFRWGNTAIIGIADNSGPTPDQTDDGRMFLDTTRPIKGGDTFIIPLVYPSGEMTTTIAGAAEALWLASHFNMELHSRESKFKVQEIK